MSNRERNTDTQGLCTIAFIAVLAIMLIISSSYATAAQSMSSSQDNSKSAHIPSVGLVTNSSNTPNSSAIHNQVSASTKPPYPTTTSNSNLGSKSVVGKILSNGSSNKVVIINFDDGYKSQLIYAKPILDKYGFKASFFIVCSKVATQPLWLNWQDIALLKKDGMDIESHTMTHAHLNTLVKTPSQLTYEIAGSKQCLASHGYNATIFGYPNNLGSNIPSVINMVAKYYNVGRSGTDPLMFLNCSGYAKDPQTDCRTFSTTNKITHANRYDIRSASFYHISSHHNLSPSQMFQVFLQIVNSQTPYNQNTKINAIPIIVYHNLTNSIQDYGVPSHASSTTLDLFAQEMKYLHDNGFKVLTLKQLGYDTMNNIFYIKNIPSFSYGNTTNHASTIPKNSSSYTSNTNSSIA